MIRSTHCSRCKLEIVFPEEWIGRSVQCPRCKRVLEITRHMFGMRPEKRGRHSRRIWGGVAGGAAVILLLLGQFLLGPGRSERAVAIHDPILKLRCTNCDWKFQARRASWEEEVFASAHVETVADAGGVVIPEEIPLRCSHCSEEAVFVQNRTSPCASCGHWVPNFTPSLFSTLHRPAGCRHCKTQPVQSPTYSMIWWLNFCRS